MAYKDLREYIDLLEKKDLLCRIKEEVDPELEITEISNRVVKQNGPALFFEKVKGFSMPVVTNLFGSYERMNMALETASTDKIAERISNLTNLSPPENIIDKISTIFKLKEISNYIPKKVKTAPCKDVIIKDGAMFDQLPVLKCWPDDGGRFITLPMVITKNPKTNIRNVGMYRMHIYDNITSGMHWHIHKDGAKHFHMAKNNKKRLEVAVAIGSDPAVIYASTAPLPEQIDEFIFAGFLRKKSVELIRCETVNLEVPANSEIVLEGYVDFDKSRIEGPFGDHTGYYSPSDSYPVFHLQCITRRKDAIYPATIVGKPPMEDCFIGKATERIFLPLLKTQMPEICDINLPIEGVFHNCAIISIDKTYPGQAQKIAYGLWGLGQMMFTKIMIIVDKDVDVQNIADLSWRVFNNIDPRRDVFFAEGPVDVLDHASDRFGYGSKMGIDATQKIYDKEIKRPWPDDIVMDENIKELVNKKWNKYGIKNINVENTIE